MGSIKEIFKNKLVQLTTYFYDPLLDFKIGNQTIKLPLSHRLRPILETYPDFNFNLGRLAKYITTKEKDVKLIDIGANIGDTVAFVKTWVDIPILCIDGDEKYIEILKSNVAQYNNVTICHSLVGAETKEINLELKKGLGTAYLVESKQKNTMSTMEDILEKYPTFKNSRILKIDTDGFDTIILKSCPDYLKKNQPVLFFEFDPFLISNNNDDPFSLFPYLKSCGYQYIMVYMSNGDFLLSCSLEDETIANQIVHYVSGRNLELYVDICAFSVNDKEIYELCVKEEVQFFKKARKY